MAIYDTGDQLPLPIEVDSAQPCVGDSAAFRAATRPTAAPHSASELSNAQLLSVLLGSSHSELCERLLAAHPNWREIGALNRAVLVDYGFSTVAIARLEAVIELAKRHGEVEWPIGALFRSSGDIYLHFRERLAVEPVEVFYAVLLDNRNRKIRDIVLSRGSLTASLVHPRDVFSQIVRHSAAAVTFVHNHPSGDPTPSREDLEITRRLREVGELIGVRVLDHIIVGRGRYMSFVDDGYW